jgi:pimeloyl-ACP methyl ester carboxylesterase
MIVKQTGYFKSFDGTKIYYESRGEGPAIVLCYGIGCLINHWRNQIKAFSENYHVIAFDFRSHHKTGIPQDRSMISVDALARDIHSLMDHLEVSKASVWGHSFGTQVILRSFDMKPEYFHNLVFINGFASDPIAGMFGNGIASRLFDVLKGGFDLLPETLTYIWKLGINNSLAVQLSALLGGFNLTLTQLKDVEIYLRGVAAVDLQSFLVLFENMMSYDARPVFDRVTVPTLIVSGKNDSVTPQAYQEEMHRRIKNSQWLSVPYGSHCTQLDLPDLVNLRIEKFLDQVGFAKTFPDGTSLPLKP